MKKDANNIEHIQHIAARWARGQYGIISVTQLLKDLKWAPLVDRRRHHRLILLYKILNHHLAVPPEDVDIRRALRPPRRGHSRQLHRQRADAKSSPLWHSTTFRTIPEWSSLPVSWRRPLPSVRPHLINALCYIGLFSLRYKTRQDRTRLILYDHTHPSYPPFDKKCIFFYNLYL